MPQRGAPWSGDGTSAARTTRGYGVAFPLWNLPLTLAGTITLALLITLVPIRRATHLRPGDALRYA